MAVDENQPTWARGGPESLAFEDARPALSALPGQFLIKDLTLLGISLWSLGEAWKASGRAAA